jgi:hypothetical protein
MLPVTRNGWEFANKVFFPSLADATLEINTAASLD